MSEQEQPPLRTAHPRQNQLLALAGVLLGAALVVVLVFALRGGSDGPAAGSPDAVTATLAAALRAHDGRQVAGAACATARHQVAREVHGVLGSVTAATARGPATVQGDIAVAQIAVTARGRTANATVALRHVAGVWCVASFAIA